MKIFPAIDLRGGKVVRLTEGDYDKMTVYGDDPVGAATGFAAAGAECVHTVDLDGALVGETVNFSVIADIAKKSGLFLEVGGGIRDEARIARYLEAGADRVILGTVAIENPAFCEEMIKKYGAAVAVGVDARDGKVAIHGWKTVTDTDAYDISRDGKLAGLNIAAYERLSRISGLKIVASGGLTRADEIVRLREMGLYGAILGKAMYTGALPLSVALAAAKED